MQVFNYVAQMKEDSKEKDLWSEDEKKEGSPSRDVARTPREILQENLPEGLSKDKKYEDDGELWEELEKLNLSDLQIVRNEQGYAVWREMPGPIHNAAVEEIQHEFQRWEKDQGALLLGTKEADVYYMNNFKKNNKRCPDFAIWGPDRLNQRGRVSAELGKKVNPHVIFQFSWGNTLANEKAALDDMSLFAGIREYATLQRPNVLYLIKAIPKGESPVHGFDVYEVRQGQRVDQPSMTYRVGGDESLTIEVAAEDMGLPPSVSSFSIPLAGIRASMEEVSVAFEEA
jgi:hypothetical protein